MGLSRRQFTKEFKLAAVRRLEQGVSIGEAARALEVNPNVLHRWRREFRQGAGNVFPGNGKQRWLASLWVSKYFSAQAGWSCRSSGPCTRYQRWRPSGGSSGMGAGKPRR